MTIEIVDFPNKNMVIFYSYVSLPEGKPPFSYGFPMVFPLKPPFFVPKEWPLKKSGLLHRPTLAKASKHFDILAVEAREISHEFHVMAVKNTITSMGISGS